MERRTFSLLLPLFLFGIGTSGVDSVFPAEGSSSQGSKRKYNAEESVTKNAGEEGGKFKVIVEENNSWVPVGWIQGVLAFSNGNKTIRKVNQMPYGSDVDAKLAFPAPSPSSLHHLLYYYEAKIVEKGGGISFGMSIGGDISYYNKELNMFAKDDIVGCGLAMEIAGPSAHRHRIFFTRNGQVVEEIEGKKFRGKEYCIKPGVILFGEGAMLEANFGPNFIFDIHNYAPKFTVEADGKSGKNKRRLTNSG